MSQLIRTLIVDDSAFVRKVVREMLSRNPYIEVVGAARDGMEGLEMAAQLKPDVITCDLTMPRMDGVSFVREQMARRALPILILSAAAQDGDHALDALDAGAVDFVRKPTALATDDLLKIRDELVEKVKVVAHAPVKVMVERSMALPNDVVDAKPPTIFQQTSRVRAVVLGISTGGPQALRYLLPQFAEDFPVPILMVLHMPVGYTAAFARKLDEVSRLRVVEAGDGMVVQPGCAMLAPAGRHLILHRAAADCVMARLSVHPIELLHRPSVDVLFQSAAEVYGSAVLGCVMTGMGKDGQEGAAWIKAKGGIVLTEAAETCVIYGMPRAVCEAGLSDACVPLDRMAQAIMERL